MYILYTILIPSICGLLRGKSHRFTRQNHSVHCPPCLLAFPDTSQSTWRIIRQVNLSLGKLSQTNQFNDAVILQWLVNIRLLSQTTGWILSIKTIPGPSPSHHHFYRWYKPLPVMGGFWHWPTVLCISVTTRWLGHCSLWGPEPHNSPSWPEPFIGAAAWVRFSGKPHADRRGTQILPHC